MEEKKYLPYLDIAKGIGIILVVVGHCIPDATSAGGISDDCLRWVDSVIYSFHMPLFFFISGYLAAPRTANFSVRELLKKRVSRLLIPYFFVGLCYMPFKLVLSAFANKPYDIGNLWQIVLGVNPMGELWFLYVLFLCTVAGVLLRFRVDGWLLLLAAVLAVFVQPIVHFPNAPLFFLFYFLGGIYVKRHQPELVERMQRWQMVLLVVCFAAMNVWLPACPQLKFLTSICGTLACLWFSLRLEGTSWGARLMVVGQYSMDIYILSDMIKIPFRMLLWNHWHLYYPAFIVCTVAALALPYYLSRYGIRRVPWLARLVLGMPRKKAH